MKGSPPHTTSARLPPTGSGGRHPHAALTDNDGGLVQLAQCGDKQAFDQLVRKYRGAVMKLALRYTRDCADAEDATQEAFIKAYRGLRRFRRECTFYTWLYRIATNSAKNVLLHRRRTPEMTSLPTSGADEGGTVPTCLLELGTPETFSATDDIRGAVNAALHTLPPEYRAALLLRELRGLSYEQIAVSMATPVGTVRSRIFRARELIDAQLRPVSEHGLGRRRRGKAPQPLAR